MTYIQGLVISGTDDEPVAGVKAGTAAIWDAGSSGTDWSPVTAPITNIGKVKFHNDLDYLKIRNVVKHTDSGMSAVSVPATAEGSVLNASTILFAHGLGYRPLVLGNISFSGPYVQPCAGSALPLVGGNPTVAPYMPRFFSLLADDTYVYMAVTSFYQVAMTVGWTVSVIDSEFQAPISDNVLFKFSPDSAVLAALGPIDAEHRFIRAASKAGEYRVLGKPTMSATISGGRPVLNYSNGDVDAAIYSSNSITYPPGSLSITGTECEIEGATVSDDPGFYLDPPMRLVAPGGELIFTTEKAMLAGLRRYTGSITTHEINPTSDHTQLFSYNHYIGPASGGDILFGWIQQVSGSTTHVGNLFGSVVFASYVTRVNPFTASIFHLMSILSLKVSGGNVYLNESGWNHSYSDPYIPGYVILSRTLDYEIYSGKMVGGD